MLSWEIIDSEAWRELTNAARVAYIHLKRKVTNPNPKEIHLGFAEMAGNGSAPYKKRIMRRKTFSTALRLLEEKGFIEKKQSGGLYRKENLFLFTEKWRNQK